MTTWNIKNFEKSKTETHVNIFRSLEIEKYLGQLLRKKEFLDNFNFKLSFFNKTLVIFLYLYKTTNGRSREKEEKSILARLGETVLKKKKKKRLKETILKSLKKFTDNRFHICLRIKELRKPSALLSITNNFFRLFKINTMGELCENIATKPNSMKLLGTLIARQLETAKQKQHNFFLSSLKRILAVTFVNRKDSRIKGIKVLIKGRLNNAPRSRNLILKAGKIPITTQETKTEYFQSTAFTKNGTIGIKIWANVGKIKNVFTTKKV